MIGERVDENLYAFPYGVYAEDIEAIIIADLHLGFEEALESSGIHVPISQYHKVKEMILKATEHYNPKRLIIAGDVKHEFAKASYEEWEEVTDLINSLKGSVEEIRIVRGNHDNFLIPILKRLKVPLDDPLLKIGECAIAHGHKEVRLENVKTLFIGHVHPAITIRGEFGEKTKFRCLIKGFIGSTKVYVLPAFSPYALGYDVLMENNLSPITKEMGNIEVIAIDEEAGILNLGPLERIAKLIGRVQLGFEM